MPKQIQQSTYSFPLPSTLKPTVKDIIDAPKFPLSLFGGNGNVIDTNILNETEESVLQIKALVFAKAENKAGVRFTMKIGNVRDAAELFQFLDRPHTHKLLHVVTGP